MKESNEKRIVNSPSKWNKKYYVSLDCEYDKYRDIRELSMVCFNEYEILNFIEIVISKNGLPIYIYNKHYSSCHLKNRADLKMIINGFISNCKQEYGYNINLVGVGVWGDLKSINQSLQSKTLLDEIKSISDLSYGDSGTLFDKAVRCKIYNKDVVELLNRMTNGNGEKYYYHNSLYDALVSGLVYLYNNSKNKDIFSVATLKINNWIKAKKFYYIKKTKSSSYKSFIYKSKRMLTVDDSEEEERISLNLPKVSYKPRTTISHAMDIVARYMLNKELIKYPYEQNASITKQKTAEIMVQINPIINALRKFDDVDNKITNPYNFRLLEAGVALVEKKITLNQYIDFAIYIQQYVLNDSLGNFYKVISEDHSKEIFVRCISESTARKCLYKKNYCSINQFLHKNSANGSKVEIIN